MYALLPYVIHKHNAKHAGLHFDFRIKYPNKNLLASWALPKATFPQKPGEKFLAIKVNDHGRYWLNVDSMDIPEGEHGHGHLDAVQKGIAEVEGWGPNYVTFNIKGKIATGRFSLIKIKPKEQTKDDVWVLVKNKDQNIKNK
jgi:bifunctional non-homologous end joining protein LigD